MEFFCFRKRIDTDLLSLSKIVYGGEFYYSLRNYRLKEIETTNSKFKKVSDELLKRIGSTRFYSYKNESSGFVANLFENIKNGKLVIAYRGTERIGIGENNSDLIALGKDMKTDLNLILSIPDEQINNAYEFYNLVKKQFPKEKITIVGQSLGGALAQLVAAKIYTDTKQKVKTFTYNAPGCKHLLGVYKCDLENDYAFITNYAVMNDWCGMFGEKIGEMYLIPPIPPKSIKNLVSIEGLENILLTSHEGIFKYSGYVIKKPKNFNQAEGLSLWYFDKNNPFKEFETPSEFITTVLPSLNTPQLNSISKTLQKKWDGFIEDTNEKLQEFSTQIQTATNGLIDIQAEKIIEGLNNNSINQISQFLDATISELNNKTLTNALQVLKSLKIHKTHPEYFNSFKYLVR